MAQLKRDEDLKGVLILQRNPSWCLCSQQKPHTPLAYEANAPSSLYPSSLDFFRHFFAVRELEREPCRLTGC